MVMHRLTLSFLMAGAFLLVASPLFAVDQKLEERFQRAMREGISLAQDGGEEPNIRATARFKEAIRLKPRSVEARCRLALSYLDRGDYLGAEENAEKATHISPDNYLPWLILGSAQFYIGKPKAEDSLKKAFSIEPKQAHTTYMLGRNLYFSSYNRPDKRDALGQALKYFKRTLELDATYIQARFMIGCCWLDLEMPALAYEELQQALRGDPNNPEVHFRLGLCAIAMKTYINAEQHLRNALRYRPRYADAYLTLGHLLLNHLANREEAILNYQRFLQTANQSHPQRAQVLKLLGKKE